jgi:hypothetical protein
LRKEDVRSSVQSDFDELEEGHVIHHIFPGSRRRLCEKYGYLYRVTPYIHKLIHDYPNDGLDLMLKQTAQRHFETHHGNREDFIREFGRSYL